MVYRYLSVVPNGEQLLQQLIEQFLFSAHLWNPMIVQEQSHNRMIRVLEHQSK